MSAVRVLHVLPHRGGGAETFVDMLEALPGTVHERVALSAHRELGAGLPSIVRRWPGVRRAGGEADLVHVHGDAAAAIALPLLRAHPAAVWTTHGLHLLRRVRGPARVALAAALRAGARAAVTTCCSQAEAGELHAIGVGGPLAVVPNGLDPAPLPDRTAARAALGLDEDEPVALFVGQLESRKGPALAAAAARAAGLRLLVAGDGPLAGTLGGAGVVELGYRDDVPVLLAAADIFVLPSEREGISFAIVEAMAAGLALVVSDGPGNPEAIGDAGIVVPQGDVAALTAGLREAVARRAELGAAAAARQRSLFTAKHLRDGIAAAYERALGE